MKIVRKNYSNKISIKVYCGKEISERFFYSEEQVKNFVSFFMENVENVEYIDDPHEQKT